MKPAFSEAAEAINSDSEVNKFVFGCYLFIFVNVCFFAVNVVLNHFRLMENWQLLIALRMTCYLSLIHI